MACWAYGLACLQLQRVLFVIAIDASAAQEEAVEYVAATVRKLTQEAAAEGVRRLFLISVSANPTPSPKLNLIPAGRRVPFPGVWSGCACPHIAEVVSMVRLQTYVIGKERILVEVRHITRLAVGLLLIALNRLLVRSNSPEPQERAAYLHRIGEPGHRCTDAAAAGSL